MLNFITSFIFGILEDNAGLFVYPELYNVVGTKLFPLVAAPFGYVHLTYQSSQPIMWTVYFFFANLINPIFFYNLVVILSFILTYYFSSKLFKQFISSKFITYALGLIFTFSPYFYYSSRNHIDLMQFWVVLVFLNLYFKENFKYKNLVLGLLTAVMFGISNYLGFFLLLFVGCYYASSLVVYLLNKRGREEILHTAANHIRIAVFFSLFLVIIFTPFIVFKSTSEKASNYPVRSMSDFVIFSSRPWYFFLPSTDNPFFGQITESTIDFLQNDWGHFLAQNYFKSEHSISFLGWLNIILAIVGLIYFIRKKEKDIRFQTLILTAALLFIFTLPPYFTISGMRFNTPGLLLFNILPIFRVMSRLSLFILLITLIFTGLGYMYLLRTIRPSLFRSVVISFLVVFSLAEFFIPLKFTYIGETPNVYTEISKKPEESLIAVYPYSKTNEALFWLKDFKRPLINPRDFEDPITGFEAEVFTINLITQGGIYKMKGLGVNYLIYFYNADEDYEKNKLFFDSNPCLKKEVRFEGKKASKFKNVFYSIDRYDDPYANAAIIYELIDCARIQEQ